MCSTGTAKGDDIMTYSDDFSKAEKLDVGFTTFRYAPIYDEIAFCRRCRDLLAEMMEMMNHKDNPYEKTHYWADGEEFLCDTEERADYLFDFLEALGMEPHTGYYDPEEDERSGEVDGHTGWYYVDFD